MAKAIIVSLWCSFWTFSSVRRVRFCFYVAVLVEIADVRFDNLRFSSRIQNLISNRSISSCVCVHSTRLRNAFKEQYTTVREMRCTHKHTYNLYRSCNDRTDNENNAQRRMTHKSVTLREKRKIYWICRRFVCAGALHTRRRIYLCTEW